jgi:hypothetical protein
MYLRYMLHMYRWYTAVLAMKSTITTLARPMIEIALQQGETVETIASLCGVSPGSVKRWLATGRAAKDRIAPLAEKVGPVYPSPSEVARDLIAIKKRMGKRPIRVKRSYVKKIAGRTRLKGSFESDLIDCLDGHGYAFIEAIDEQTDDDVYLMFKRKWLFGKIQTAVKKADMEDYFVDRLLEVDDDEDSSGDESPTDEG